MIVKLLTWIYQAVLTGLLVVFGNKKGVVTPTESGSVTVKKVGHEDKIGGRTTSLIIIDDPMRPDWITERDKEFLEKHEFSQFKPKNSRTLLPWVDEDLHTRSKTLR